MASLTTINVAQNNYRKWSYKRMQEFMKYLGTYNSATQTLAIDAGAKANPQTTGTALVFLNGQPIKLAADGDFVISTDTTEVTQTAWATATSYSVGNIRWGTPTGVNSVRERFRCITAHTSSADDEPRVGGQWEDYWEAAPHGAVNAVGDVLTDGQAAFFMVTAQADGTLNVWAAGDAATTGTEECKIPQFDHKLYVCIGFLHIATSGASFILGTTDLDAGTATVNYLQQIGPVFPHEDNWDAN